MHMKSLIIRACLPLAAAAALVSCNTGEQTLYYNSYMTAVETEGQPYRCIFVTDDSTTVIPLNFFPNIEDLKTDDRIIATFSIPSGRITDPVEVEFTSMAQLLPQSVIMTSSPDTIANDPADPMTMWHSGGVKGASRYLTVTFNVQASSSGIAHGICLVDDLSAENPDADGYYHLKFRHSANNDPIMYTSANVATFPLADKYSAPGIKGIKVDFRPITPGIDSTLTVTY